MQKPLVLEIKSNSLDDGAGIRTVVFFKGCPLTCIWCHNPESKNQDAELYYSKEDCIGCGTCQNACKNHAISFDNKYFIDRIKCNNCFECVAHCPSKALRVAGESHGLKTLVEKFDPAKFSITYRAAELPYRAAMLRYTLNLSANC